MIYNNIIMLERFRAKKIEKHRGRKRKRSKGSIVKRGDKLWFDLRYMGQRVREPSGQSDTALNRKQLQKRLQLIAAEIDNGVFEFAVWFPDSRKRDYFTELEGRNVTRNPDEIQFGEYVERWWQDMKPGLTESQVRDYKSALNCHLLPYFGEEPFKVFWSRVQMKKFIADMKAKKNRYGKPLSGKRIQNVFNPLRVIVADAMDEYDWYHLHNPFAGLKLPKSGKFRIQPFSFDEWQHLMKFFLPIYRPYFQFAVQTGLRPSEQVAIKKSAIDDRFIHIELSRVRNREKTDLKTDESYRRIDIRPSLQKVIDEQLALTADFESDYLFVNTQGRPILQDKLREVYARAIEKSGLAYRRMYETRHTFASWALAAGETPEWVAKTLGHINTAMIYKTYARYIPNLLRNDGSAFERQYTENVTESLDTIGHNFGHNGQKSPISPSLSC